MEKLGIEDDPGQKMYFCDECFNRECKNVVWGYQRTENGPTDHRKWRAEEDKATCEALPNKPQKE